MEYQREGFDLFVAMLDGIKEESVGFLFNVEVTVEQTEDSDGDGVVAIPPDKAAQVAVKAQEKVDAEVATLKAIAAGTYTAPWVDETLKAKGM